MFTDAADLIDAIEGNQGEEAQQEALDFAEQTGLLDQWQAAEDQQGNDQYTQELAAELARVEKSIGRELTAGEERALIDTISTQEFTDGVVPDFVAEQGETLASAQNHEAGRLHLGTEAAQRVFDEQGRGDQGRSDLAPQPQFRPPDDTEGEGDF
jgi:hypothetical protein